MKTTLNFYQLAITIVIIIFCLAVYAASNGVPVNGCGAC